MGTTYLGSVTVGGAVVGISAQLDLVAAALATFKATVSAKLALIADAQDSISSQISASASAHDAIRFVAVADLQAQVDASLNIQTSLGVQVSDPTAYFQGLVAALVHVQADLSALVPSVEISAQLSASESLSLSLTAKIAALDLQLELVLAIQAALEVILSAIVAISAALSAAISVVLAALSVYTSFAANLGMAGVKMFLYTGPLASFGASVDAVASLAAGISGSADVRIPIMIVETSDAPLAASLNAVVKTS